MTNEELKARIAALEAINLNLLGHLDNMLEYASEYEAYYKQYFAHPKHQRYIDEMEVSIAAARAVLKENKSSESPTT